MRFHGNRCMSKGQAKQMKLDWEMHVVMQPMYFHSSPVQLHFVVLWFGVQAPLSKLSLAAQDIYNLPAC